MICKTCPLTFAYFYAYAYFNTKAIEKKEIVNFGWYIDSIISHTRVVKYCKNNGFEDIIKLSDCY